MAKKIFKMSGPYDLKVKFLLENMKNLHKTVAFMKEDQKIWNKKMEFMQDNNARLAVEMQAIGEAIRFISSIAGKVIDQREKQTAQKRPEGIG